jgi:hypothetical protein
VLNKPENMKRLTTDLTKFGIDCTKTIEHIQDHLEDLLDVPVEIEVKTTKSKKDDTEYRNISIKPLN